MSSKLILVDPSENRISVIKKVINLALPIMGGNILYSIENIISVILVSSLSPSAIAAVGFSSSMLWFTYSLMAIAYSGTVVLVAQRVGAKKDPSVAFVWGIILAIIIGLPLTFFGTDFVTYLMSKLGASESVVTLAKQYLKPVFSVIVLAFVSEVFYGAFNGAGDTKTPFKIAISYTIIHIVFAYLLIYGTFGFPRLEVFGAGLGLAIAEVIGFLIYVFLLVAKKKPFPVKVELDFHLLKTFLRVGVPTAIERAITSFSFNVFVGILARFGDTILAAHQVGLRVESISFMVGFSFMIASTTISGQNYGAKNYLGLDYAVRTTANLSAFLMGLAGVALIAFPGFFAGIFTKDPQVIQYATYYLIIVALSQPQLAYASAYSGTLKGMGKTHIPLIVNSLSFWVFRIIPSYALLYFFYTPLVPWVMMSVETTIRAVIFYMAYRKEINKVINKQF